MPSVGVVFGALALVQGLTALAPSALASDYAIKDVQDGYEVSFISIVEAPAKTGIMSLAFDADADHMAFGDKSGLVHIFDAISDELQVTLEGHTDWVRGVAFSSDTEMLASASDDKTVRVWNVASGEEIAVLEGHTDWVRSVAWLDLPFFDNEIIVTASDDETVRIWDIDGTEMLELEVTDWSRAVATSPDGNYIAAASDDGFVHVWVLDSDLEAAPTHSMSLGDAIVRTVKFVEYEGDIFLLAANDDKTLGVWQLEESDMEELATFELEMEGVTINDIDRDIPTELFVIAAADGAYVLDSELELVAFISSGSDVYSAKFLPGDTDEDHPVAVIAIGGESGTVEYFRITLP